MIPSVVCFYSFLFFSYFYFSVRQPSIEQGRSSPPPESRTVCPSWLRTPGQGASARSPRPWRRPWPLSGQSWASRWGDSELVWPEAEQEAALEKVTGQETEVGAVRAGAHTALEDGANFLLVTVWQKSHDNVRWASRWWPWYLWQAVRWWKALMADQATREREDAPAVMRNVKCW